MSSKKTKVVTPLTTYSVNDIVKGNIEVDTRASGLFKQIREQVLEVLKPGEGALVANIIWKCPALASLKGAMRYNYLRNAMKNCKGFEFMTQNGRLFLIRKS